MFWADAGVVLEQRFDDVAVAWRGSDGEKKSVAVLVLAVEIGRVLE